MKNESMPRTANDLLAGDTLHHYDKKAPDKPETPDYQQAKIDAMAYIASLGITADIKCNGVAETPAESKEDKPWLHFRWLCSASRPRGNDALFYIANFDGYKTGIGNATFQPVRFNPPCGGSVPVMQSAKNKTLDKYLDPQTRIDACRYLKPTPPDIADILGSYARDYVDAHQAGSFEDWAANCGYDEDSRKGERIYQTCLAQRKPLLALGPSMAEIEKIAEYASQF